MVGFLGARGLDLSTMDPATRDQILALVVWGSPDEVGENAVQVLASGVDGITCSLPRTATSLAGSRCSARPQPRCSAESPHRDRVNVALRRT